MKLQTFFDDFPSTFFRWLGPLPLIITFLTIPSLSLSQPLNYYAAGDINPPEFLAVSSDEEATSLFRKTFGRTLGLHPPQSTQRAKPGKRSRAAKKDGQTQSPKKSTEMSDEILQFMAHVIISIRASRFQSVNQVEDLQSLSQLINRDTPQAQWLLSGSQSKELNQFMELTARILKLSEEPMTQTNQPPPHFSAFARYFDQSFPHIVAGEDSWVSILEHKGPDAIINRFNEYWEVQSSHSPASAPTPEISPDQQQEFVHYYLKTRLLPVYISHLIAKSIQLQAITDYQAGQSWVRLTKINESNQKIRALKRLCGTWLWTVHNHLNHQDQKMTLAFSPSPQQIPGQPEPEIIIMNGDTVYLKWTFPMGYQEDSLLLSNRDQRLEGTFKNSRGPHGNISGKRLSDCRR